MRRASLSAASAFSYASQCCIKLIVLLPPTSRHLFSSDQDREEGPVAGDLGVQRSQPLHDFR